VPNAVLEQILATASCRACRCPVQLLRCVASVWNSMTTVEFKKKWSRYQGKETSAYQSHFDDLCRLLGLLPKKLYTEITKTGIDDPKHFSASLEKLFAVMAKVVHSLFPRNLLEEIALAA
jgi:hypothetical protein